MPHWHIKRFLRFHLSNEIHKILIKVFKRSNFAKMHFGSEHFAHHSWMLTLMEKLAVAQYSSGSQTNVNLHSCINSSSLKMLMFPEKKEKNFQKNNFIHFQLQSSQCNLTIVKLWKNQNETRIHPVCVSYGSSTLCHPQLHNRLIKDSEPPLVRRMWADVDWWPVQHVFLPLFWCSPQ